MGFAPAALLLPFLFALAERRCLKPRAKPTQSRSSACCWLHPAVTGEHGPRSRVSLCGDSPTEPGVLLGEKGLLLLRAWRWHPGHGGHICCCAHPAADPASSQIIHVSKLPWCHC